MMAQFAAGVTPLGLMLIDGYVPQRDWLRADIVLSTIEALPRGRVIWFGIESGVLADGDLRAGLAERNVLMVNERLGDVLELLELSGTALDELVYSIAPPNAISLAGKGRHSFVPSADLRLRVQPVASIVDDSWIAPLGPLSEDEEYVRFRRFHGNLDGPRELVEGVRRGFAIVRDSEARLNRVVKRAINAAGTVRDPIIVSGQSGTGKSVALVRLISEIVQTQHAAVVYARSRLPSDIDLDDFCSLADGHNAAATVIVCDLNLPLPRYRELLHGLRSRGRKAVVVGSAYRLPRGARKSNLNIEFDARLSPSEKTRLSELLLRYNLSSEAAARSDDPSFLARLYRTLPPARPQLLLGLTREARSDEARFREEVKSAQATPLPTTLLAEKLVAAGLVSADKVVLPGLATDPIDAASDSASMAIDLVMVSAQLGCSVPINLLLRAVTNDQPVDYEVLANLFSELDVIRVKESTDDAEELLVSARIRLEAELLAGARIGDPQSQASLFVRLIRAAKLNWDAGGSERRFVVDLVQRLGPDGPQRKRFREAYLDVAEALKEVRERATVADPSLALQESVLRRNAVKERTLRESSPQAVLLDAEEAVNAAIAGLDHSYSRFRRHMRVNLMVERATIYGFLAVQRTVEKARPDQVWETYRAARLAAKNASGLTGTYFPRDVRLWIPARLLKDAVWSDAQKYELSADIDDVLDDVDAASLPPDQAEKYNTRRLLVGSVMEDKDLEEDAFIKLAAAGSTAGYYLRARGMFRAEVGSTEIDRAAAERAATFLRSNWNAIRGDERCIRLLFKAAWKSKTGYLPFAAARKPLPCERLDRRAFYELTRTVNSMNGYADNLYRYIEAVLAWCLNLDKEASDLWQELSQISDFIDSRRLVRRHILTDEREKPQVFSGRIERRRDEERFIVRADELQKQVYLRIRDFPQYDLEVGRPSPKFAIAFNFIGPIADPVR